MPHSVAVFGGAGFTGALAARLLFRHPSFELKAVTARSDVGRRLDDLYPYHRVPMVLEELDLERHSKVEAAVVAYPHGAAAPLVKELLARGMKVVDLSADFRLRDPDTYEAWYREHPAPELLERAAYGLPELYREQIRDADLVANPGCYPTATLLALAPLAREGAIEDLVVDAKSGVSGAGRAASEKTHFVSVDENVAAYGVSRHRHTPEIEQATGAQVIFTPHLAPMTRGILATCYARPTGSCTTDDVLRILGDAYADAPFVVVSETSPSTKATLGSNAAHLTARVDERTGWVLVLCALDNLGKGASGQAVQCVNLIKGWNETTGLSTVGVYP